MKRESVRKLARIARLLDEQSIARFRGFTPDANKLHATR
jgi:hypothetical protein